MSEWSRKLFSTRACLSASRQPYSTRTCLSASIQLYSAGAGVCLSTSRQPYSTRACLRASIQIYSCLSASRLSLLCRAMSECKQANLLCGACLSLSRHTLLCQCMSDCQQTLYSPGHVCVQADKLYSVGTGACLSAAYNSTLWVPEHVWVQAGNPLYQGMSVCKQTNLLCGCQSMSECKQATPLYQGIWVQADNSTLWVPGHVGVQAGNPTLPGHVYVQVDTLYSVGARACLSASRHTLLCWGMSVCKQKTLLCGCQGMSECKQAIPLTRACLSTSIQLYSAGASLSASQGFI